MCNSTLRQGGLNSPASAPVLILRSAPTFPRCLPSTQIKVLVPALFPSFVSLSPVLLYPLRCHHASTKVCQMITQCVYRSQRLSGNVCNVSKWQLSIWNCTSLVSRGDGFKNTTGFKPIAWEIWSMKSSLSNRLIIWKIIRQQNTAQQFLILKDRIYNSGKLTWLQLFHLLLQWCIYIVFTLQTNATGMCQMTPQSCSKSWAWCPYVFF